MAALDFSAQMGLVQRGAVLRPLVEMYIEEATSLHFPATTKSDLIARDPDGWFHPSTHPTWTVRALWLYLRHPERLVPKKFGYSAKLAVSFGVNTHNWIQHLLGEMGLLPAHLQVCSICPPGSHCHEPGMQHQPSRTRTHLDGLLSLPGCEPGSDVFEFKTTGDQTWPARMRLSELVDLDLDCLIKAWPEYRVQVNEGMRISGRRRAILLLMVLGNPFDLREFHVPFDQALADETTEKYLTATDAALRPAPPACGCGNDWRRCPARKDCDR